jgi:hypothetical protein
MSTPNPPPPPPTGPPAPRVGSIDNGVPWVGGSGLTGQLRTAPLDILCYRPSDFRSKQRQYESLKAGLEVSRRLELGDNKKDHAMSLVAWIQEIKLLVETRGFDTIFRVTNSTTPTSEVYIVEKWGDMKLKAIEDFVATLTDSYDLENLRLSGLAIRDSLGPELYSRVSSLSTPDKSGPVLFKIAVDQVMHMNDAQIRNLSNKLGEIRLRDIPGENVAKLGETITQIAREITGSGREPNDLLQLVSRPYTKGTAKMFESNALTLHSRVLNGTSTDSWEKLVAEHSTFYQDLVQAKDYPPAEGGKEDEDSKIQGLIAKAFNDNMGKLIRHSKEGNNGGGNGGGSGYQKRKCFRCGSEDHIIKNCTVTKDKSAKDWRSVPPDTSKNEPKEKTVEGVIYKWCGRCRGGRGSWNSAGAAHFTADHRSGTSTGDEPVPPPPAPTEEIQEQGNLGYVDQPLSFGFLAVTPPYGNDMDSEPAQDHPTGLGGEWEDIQEEENLGHVDQPLSFGFLAVTPSYGNDMDSEPAQDHPKGLGGEW